MGPISETTWTIFKIPLIIGRSKKKTFVEIKESVWKKLQGWKKDKFISIVGKEIHVKAIAHTWYVLFQVVSNHIWWD